MEKLKDVKIHLIFNQKDNEDNALVKPFKEYGILVDYDADFNGAIKRLEDPESIKPDYIISSELALTLSKNKYETLTKQLELIRQLAPDAKITLLMDNNPEEEFVKAMKDIKVDIVLGQECMFDIDEVLKLKEERNKLNKASTSANAASAAADEKGEQIPAGLENLAAKIDSKADKDKKEQPANSRKKIKKVLQADGHAEFIETIKGMSGIKHVGFVESREEFFEKFSTTVPDIIILSPDLPGEEDLLELIDSVDKDPRIIVTNTDKLPDIDVEIMKNYGVEVPEEDSIAALETLLKKNSGRLVPRLEVDISPPGENVYQEGVKKTSTLNLNTNNLKRAADNVEKAIQSTGDIVATAKEKMSSIKIKIGTKSRIVPNLVVIAGVKSVGKTTVATNLAWKLADSGNIAALVDCSPDQDIHTWFKVPFEEIGLYTAMSTNENPEDLVWAPKLMRDLWILTSDLESCNFLFSQKEMAKVVSSLCDIADFVVVDLASKLDSNQARTLLQMAACIILVADSDIAHTVKLQRVFRDLEKDITEDNYITVVANNFDESEMKELNSIRAAVNMNEEFVIPHKAIEVRKSIRKGVPLCGYDADFSLVFSELADYVEAISRKAKQKHHQ